MRFGLVEQFNLNTDGQKGLIRNVTMSEQQHHLNLGQSKLQVDLDAVAANLKVCYVAAGLI